MADVMCVDCGRTCLSDEMCMVNTETARLIDCGVSPDEARNAAEHLIAAQIKIGRA